SGFSKNAGAISVAVVFTTHPRFMGGFHSCERLLCRRVIQMSPAPQPPGRVLWKNITCSSEESTARESAALVLSADMFWGSAQGSSSEARVVNQRSSPPRPPGRSEVKYIVNSSRERKAYVSLNSVFTGGPTLNMGEDHSPNVSALRC